MRYMIVFLLAVAGCSSKYDDCLEKERENYRQSNPNASHSMMNRKQQEFEMMCSRYKGKQLEYHAHIYWTNEPERTRALSFRNYLNQHGCILGRIWDQPVGPHPLPMYQAIYDSSNKELVEQFLRKHRETNTVLLHESINDDLRDHTEGARWLGEALELKLEIFNE